jgi:hypothetical protein
MTGRMGTAMRALMLARLPLILGVAVLALAGCVDETIVGDSGESDAGPDAAVAFDADGDAGFRRRRSRSGYE